MKILIDIKDDIEPTQALTMVSAVISKGRYSNGGKRPLYCFISSFHYGQNFPESRQGDFIVEVADTAKVDSFKVYREYNEEE